MDEQNNMDGYTEIKSSLWKPKEKGEFIEGIYLGCKAGLGQKDSKLYTLENTDKKMNFWGSVILDDIMLSVKFNQSIKVVYNGMISKEGKNSYYDYKVYKKEQ